MDSPHLTSHSLTDDQKVMEQCGYSSADYYQEIDSSHSHLYSSLTDTTDDYESIEDVKRDNELEWRVLSRLEGEIGEDWRIVNSMPRNNRNRRTENVKLQRRCDDVEFKDKRGDITDCKVMANKVMARNMMAGSHSACEHAVNAKNFLEQLRSEDREDFYQAESPVVTVGPEGLSGLPAAYLRKQVTFGKLLVFPCWVL